MLQYFREMREPYILHYNYDGFPALPHNFESLPNWQSIKGYENSKQIFTFNLPRGTL